MFYIFSIVGISIFYNSFHNCYVMKSNGDFKLAISSFENNLADYNITNDISSISKFCADKYNGIMDTGPTFKYSNIATSLITSYVLATQEAWPNISDSYRIYSDLNGLFFVAYNLVTAYFALNLFTGIMFRYFNEAYKRETKLAEDDKKAPTPTPPPSASKAITSKTPTAGSTTSAPRQNQVSEKAFNKKQ